jgi:predicted PurR-regulated permease PerM
MDRHHRIASAPLTGLFVLAMLYSVHVARPVLLPVVLAALLAILLVPVAAAFGRIGLPRVAGAGITVVLLIAIIAWGAFTLAGPASDWLADAPELLREVQVEIESLRGRVRQVSEAAEEVGEITRGGAAEAPRVSVEGDAPAEILVRGATGITTTIVLTLALVFFLLASGRLFLLKLMRVLPGYRARKRALVSATAIRRNLSTHLLTVTAINTVLGIAVGIALGIVGVPNPVLWGVMAGVLNFVPYLGAMFGIAVVGAVAITTMDSIGVALLAPLVYLVLTGLEGIIITPAILGARLRLNPLAILLGVMLWGWLWGMPGALLAVPILTTLKVIADGYPRLMPLAEFLGR